MKDFFGNKLNIGDIVAFERPDYRELLSGKIIGFENHKVLINYNLSASLHEMNLVFSTYPSKVVKKVIK